MNNASPTKRRLLISCVVLQREIDDALTKTARAIDVKYLPLGLQYDLPALVATYGEENGPYVYNQLQHRPYARHVYVSTNYRLD